MYTRSDCRYRSNPPPVGKMRWGRRVRDQNCSFPTHERRLIEDEWGMMVDPRFGSFDTKDNRTDNESLR